MINLIENNYVQRQKLENGQTIYCLHNTKINLVENDYIVKIRNTKHTVNEQKFKSKSQNYYLNTKKILIMDQALDIIIHCQFNTTKSDLSNVLQTSITNYKNNLLKIQTFLSSSKLIDYNQINYKSDQEKKPTTSGFGAQNFYKK